MQNKSVSLDLEKNRSLKRKIDNSNTDDTLFKNKKLKIIYEETNNSQTELIKETANHQNDKLIELPVNEKIDLKSKELKNDDLLIQLDENERNNEDNESTTIEQNELKFNKSQSAKKLALTNNPINYQQSTDSNYIKYYLNQLNQLPIKDTDKLNNLEQTERSINEQQFRLENQLNYVQLLNYHHLMQKQFGLNKNNSILDNNQIKNKLINHQLNEQIINPINNQLNSQLINSPDFKQLIEKNRTLRLNLAYQKLQAENPNLLLPIRTVRPCRRQRTTFTNEQTIKLEIEFRQSEYISRNKRFQLADLLDLSENQIKIWFQNRRAKDKRLERAILDQQLKQIWN